MTFLMRLLCLIFLLCFATSAQAQTEPAPHILVDQFGYLPTLEKRAIIRDPVVGFDAERSFTPGPRYAVINQATRRAVFTGSPVSWNNGTVDDVSGDRVWWFDFSSVQTTGRYVIRDIERQVDSDPFEISPTVYRTVLQNAFKAFYYQRAGFEKREPFVMAGYADKASHLGKGQDTEAQRYDRPGDMSTARDLRGGWYDAGDYNQYTSWTANYISSLLFSYIENRAVWTDEMGIPESGNGVPDVLDEVIWGLTWLERMQNPDGSMLSVLGRAEGSPPSKSSGPSLYGLKNSSATVTAAGAFAMAADIFQSEPALRDLSDRYADRAFKAWAWAEANPNVKFYNNSEEHGTSRLAAGQQEVESDRFDRKKLMAAIQLFSLTGEEHYCQEADRLYSAIGGITSDMANGFEGDLGFTLLHFAKMDGVPRRLSQKIQRDYVSAMEAHNGWDVVRRQGDAYGAYTDGYWWGSNSTKSRRGLVFTQAIVGGVAGESETEALNAASHYLHYLHGVNPMGLVYLTNMEHAGAERSASTLYHAWFKDGSKLWDSTKTSRFGPAPGHLVGGPNDGYARDDCCDNVCGGYGDDICRRPSIVPPENQPPAKSYGEFNEGWPLNSWSVTENSLSYQSDYIRLLSKFAR